MWSYYGSKSKIVDYYPPPKHNKIIEPFAGSARYALKYWNREVLLVDKYDVIVRLWKWLQKATEGDIKNLPVLKKGDDIRKFNLSEEERLLLGFYVQAGCAKPGNVVSSMGEDTAKTMHDNLLSKIDKIRHWQIIHGDYWNIPNQEATWFIDPPYQYGGEYYKHSSKQINFYDLSVWCRDRKGQAIVCENTKANWLPFKPMQKIQGARQTFTVEAIWSNHPTNYDNEQLKLIA